MRNDLRIIHNPFWEQMPRVQISNELIGYERIEKDLQEGCIFAECVFKLYIQMILRELEDY